MEFGFIYSLQFNIYINLKLFISGEWWSQWWSFQYLNGAYKQEGSKLFERLDNSRTRGNGFKLKEGRFRLDIRGSSLLWERWGAGTGCPERLWVLHPWRCSRLGWMEPWAAWASIKWGGWQPCLWQRGRSLKILEVPSNLGHSVILWWPINKHARNSRL